MNCPRCMTPLALSNTQGVEIDYCPNCRGVWLDRGELEKIIERSNESSQRYGWEDRENNGREGYYGHHDGHHDDHHDDHGYSHGDGHGYGRRRKGFLGDLFDF